MKPLILSTYDVQAIIAGRKIRHSLPVKNKHVLYQLNVNKHVPEYFNNSDFSPFGSPGDSEWQTGNIPHDGYYWAEGFSQPVYLFGTHELASNVRWGLHEDDEPKEFEINPIGWKRMGTVLYGREAWRLRGWDFEEGTMLVEYATGEKKNCPVHDPSEDSEWLMDQVDYMIYKGYIIPDPKGDERYVFTDKKQPFNSPISMPREAARIFLENTGETCKRIQDITQEEAKAEGVFPPMPHRCPGWENKLLSHNDCFKCAYTFWWKQRHGPDSWNNNEFVFSCNWKVLSVNGKPNYL